MRVAILVDVVWYLVVFYFSFHDDYSIMSMDYHWAFSHMLIAHLYSILKKKSIQVLCSFLHQVVILWVVRVFYSLDINPLADIYIWQMASVIPKEKVSSSFCWFCSLMHSFSIWCGQISVFIFSWLYAGSHIEETIAKSTVINLFSNIFWVFYHFIPYV